MTILYEIAQVISIFWAFALPAVGTSLYFYSKPTTDTSLNGVTTTTTIDSSNELKLDFINDQIKSTDDQPKFSTKRAALLLWTHFKESYSNSVVVQWSLWWALAACGFSQVDNLVCVFVSLVRVFFHIHCLRFRLQ